MGSLTVALATSVPSLSLVVESQVSLSLMPAKAADEPFSMAVLSIKM